MIQEMIKEFVTNSFWEVNLKKTNLTELESFRQKYRLPLDYQILLNETDGFTIFNSGDHRINDMRFVDESKSIYQYKDKILPVGYFWGYSLVINQNEANSSHNFYAGDATSFNEFVCLGTITDFLQGILQNKGEEPYWDYTNSSLYHNFEA